MNITSYIDSHEIEFKGPNSRGFITLSECPFCGKKYKMYVSIEDGEWSKGFFKCFSCENKSIYKVKNGSEYISINPISGLISQLENISLLAANNKYFKRKSIGRDTYKRLELNTVNSVTFKQKALSSVIKDWKQIPLPKTARLLEKKDKTHIDYLKSRGLSLEDSLKLNVHIIPSLTGKYYIDRFYERVIFPLTIGNINYGFIARDITGRAEKKVLNSSGPLSTEYFWNFDNVKNQNEIVIVEGIFDATSCGIENTMASLGKVFNISQSRIRLLKAMNIKKITIYLDNGAWDSAQNLANILSSVLTDTDIYIANNRPVLDKTLNGSDHTFLDSLKTIYRIEGQETFITPNELKILKDSAKYYIKYLDGETVSAIYSRLEKLSFYKEKKSRLKKIKHNLRHINEQKTERKYLEFICSLNFPDANDMTKQEVQKVLSSAHLYIPGLNNISI